MLVEEEKMNRNRTAPYSKDRKLIVPARKNFSSRRKCNPVDDSCGLVKTCPDCMRILYKCEACQRQTWPRKDRDYRNEDRIYVEKILLQLEENPEGEVDYHHLQTEVSTFKYNTDFHTRGKIETVQCLACQKDPSKAKPYCTGCGTSFWGDDCPEYTDRCANEWTAVLSGMDVLCSQMMEQGQDKNIELAQAIRMYLG